MSRATQVGDQVRARLMIYIVELSDGECNPECNLKLKLCLCDRSQNINLTAGAGKLKF